MTAVQLSFSIFVESTYKCGARKIDPNSIEQHHTQSAIKNEWSSAEISKTQDYKVQGLQKRKAAAHQDGDHGVESDQHAEPVQDVDHHLGGRSQTPENRPKGSLPRKSFVIQTLPEGFDPFSPSNATNKSKPTKYAKFLSQQIKFAGVKEVVSNLPIKSALTLFAFFFEITKNTLWAPACRKVWNIVPAITVKRVSNDGTIRFRH